MKKTIPLIIMVTLVTAGGLGFDCDNGNGEPDLGNFSIEVIGDTVKSVSLGETGEFSFKVLNHTD